MRKLIKELDKGDMAEIKEFYDGTAASIFHLSRLFNINYESLAYFLNYKNYKKKSIKYRKKRKGL